ncbi:hypothetical protein Nepgr_019146 [Nepenthes gracilis]|uniref:Uncharacterized protein n=1 Tax=Nepenthes gracilis TaxID=150966 RepID=A0AAD3SUP1_NEPGR|nr:hypothetical protein Nepgr_019146 [Nepenthes gracilis]
MAESSEQSQSEKVSNFLRKPTNNKNIRKRAIEEDEDEDSKTEPKDPLFQHETSKEIKVHNSSIATATLETETEISRDARAIREKPFVNPVVTKCKHYFSAHSFKDAVLLTSF